MAVTEPNFESFFNLKLTQVPPDDWWVVPVDIEGSSAAITEGKAREVNLVGAASIAAIRNEFGSDGVPYIFGGDGACFLVAPPQLERVEKKIRAVQNLVRERLNFHLRVGKMSVGKIHEKGGSLRYGFLSVGKSEGFHFFRGNGFALAEKLLKASNENINLDESKNHDQPDLSGLSCKLDPFKSDQGNILSVIIEPNVPIQEEDELFKQIIQVFCGRKKLSDFKPITHHNQRRSWVSNTARTEAKLFARSLIEAVIENVLVTFLFRTNIKINSLGKPSDYTDTLLKQSDWIKMDGSLRMVVEASHEEGQRLHDVLQDFFKRGKLYFGIAKSKEAV
ncbi:MAG: DUF3095 family protein, partial [Pseudomonadota bacterium]